MPAEMNTESEKQARRNHYIHFDIDSRSLHCASSRLSDCPSRTDAPPRTAGVGSMGAGNCTLPFQLAETLTSGSPTLSDELRMAS